MLDSIKSFNSVVWFIIFQTLMSRFTLFMVWPFLALILHENFNLNEFEIGMFLSFSLISGIFIGFFAGNLSDRIGREKVISFGLVLNVFAMFLMGYSSTLEMFFAGAVLQAISRSLVENPGKALITDYLPKQKDKEMALHIRYFVINIGTAFGPIVGLSFGLTGAQDTFFIVSFIYLLSFFLSIFIFKKRTIFIDKSKNINKSFKSFFKILKQDHAFLIFVFANSLTFLCFIQIDAGLLQYLRIYEFEEVTKLYAFLILINGLTIVILQFPVLRLLKSFPAFIKALMGIFLFVLSFIIFAYVPTPNANGIILAVIVLSIGEVVLFPTINILIDKMAPNHLKGSYFGIAELAIIGAGLGPLVGGYLLEVYSGFVLWITMAVISSFVSVLLFFAQSAKRPNLSSTEE